MQYKLGSSNKRSFVKRPYVIVGGLIGLLLVAGGATAYMLTRKSPNETTTSSSQQQAESDSNENKQKFDDPPTASKNTESTQSSTTIKTVTPVISYAGSTKGQIEVNSFVPGIYEDTGSCTLTATAGTATVTKSVSVFKNASVTNCQVFLVGRDEFASAGSWKLTVRYKSATAEGVSEAKDLTIE